MRRMATVAASLSGLALLSCTVAQADPLSMEDSYYTKWLSESGVNYQGNVTTEWIIAQAHTTCAMLDQTPTPTTYQATVSRLVGGPGNFTQQEAKSTVYSAIQSYCHDHINLAFS